MEGSLIYAVSAALREAIARDGQATVHLDLLPQLTPERVLVEVRHPRGSRSLASHLKGRLGLDGIKAAVLHEVLGKEGVLTLCGWPMPSRPCPSPWWRPDPLTRPSARQAACGWKLWTPTACAQPLLAFSAPARCWTGRLPRAATC